MALASRTEQPTWAQDLLDLMEIRERFAYEEIYPSSKTKHFSRIAAASGVELHQMWFFDDENRNIVEVGEMGVTCVEVRNGLTRAIFDSLMP
jgi:magnesium-dependent phosphatase 1